MGLKITMWDFRGWIHLAEARDKTQILMKTVINLRLTYSLGNFLTKLVKFRASEIQGYSKVPPGFPNSTAQQQIQTGQKGACQ